MYVARLNIDMLYINYISQNANCYKEKNIAKRSEQLNDEYGQHFVTLTLFVQLLKSYRNKLKTFKVLNSLKAYEYQLKKLLPSDNVIPNLMKPTNLILNASIYITISRNTN